LGEGEKVGYGELLGEEGGNGRREDDSTTYATTTTKTWRCGVGVDDDGNDDVEAVGNTPDQSLSAHGEQGFSSMQLGFSRVLSNKRFSGRKMLIGDSSHHKEVGI
jgi:hypothetical protein